ncbi:MAG: sodium-translocating pyrophosphatase [Sedimentisphaerales bacterium]|nr:sodium-translocating pyrophosphatase [Sedimentisphaerales bacterium]
MARVNLTRSWPFWLLILTIGLLFIFGTVSQAASSGTDSAQTAQNSSTTAAVTATESSNAATESVATEAAEEEETGVSSWPFYVFWWLAPLGAIGALIYAFKLYKDVVKADPGDANMIEIARHVTEGAMAYLKRQYRVVVMFFIAVCIILGIMAFVFHVQHPLVPFAFLTGGFFSGLCGFLGMKTATLASNRTTQGAKESLNRGLQVAFRAGAVMGLVVVGFGLLDITLWFGILNFFGGMSLVEITVVMLCFGMGASSQALFARVGGGIYTKAADVGADLVGKVEAGIPEDDPRNPATIADNVGDNVGDVAGMGADLYESYCGSILATAALGVAAVMGLGLTGTDLINAQLRMLALPMILAGIGIAMSIIGINLVRTNENATMKQLLGALNRGINGSSVLIVGGSFLFSWLLLGGIHEDVHWWGISLSVVSGLVAGILIGKSTEYYTSYEYKPTQGISAQAETGPATVIIGGIATGMRSTWASLATVIVAIMASFAFAGGFTHFSLGLYGVGIAAVGMLATLGITLATDAYGPIADNAGGNAEMTHQDPEVRKRTDALDSLGNTTAATGKGFAIGSAALTALALMAAYVEEVRVGQHRQAETYMQTIDNAQVNQAYYMGDYKWAAEIPAEGEQAEGQERATRVVCFMDLTHNDSVEEGTRTDELTPPVAQLDNIRGGLIAGVEHAFQLIEHDKATMAQYMDFYEVTLMNPKVLCGMFAGVLLVFLFCAMTMEAVGRAAYAMVQEVRRQFKEIPGIMEGTGKPDYARCVAISTAGAQKEMVVPSLLALLVPIGVGLVLGVPGVLGLLAGGLTCGFGVAIFMANAGGAWDNAKKYIETGQHGGKGSDNHKATVVGDTVGDPFKDTSGPSLNILIKLMSMVSVVFAGLIVQWAPKIADLLGIG